ncbi:MAG: FIST C-terminal domain-containing protein [Gammaproteobacteria bacterium]|nr:FIST C-terminal domain-containing protein [Gammaproteobacteria bacterium]
MKQFLIASSQAADVTAMVAECLEQIGPVPGEFNLGFLYASDHLTDRLQTVLDLLAEKVSGLHWVGTVGMGICTGAREIYDQPALTLMLGDFPVNSFRLLSGFQGNLEQAGISGDFSFALVHADPSNSRTVEWLERLAREPGLSFINGGLTSSHGANPQIADGLAGAGVSGVVFDSSVQVITDHTQGCMPIGGKHRITEARKNIAITLDYEPALEVLKRDVGEVLSKDLTRLGGYIFAAIPIQGSDTGDYLVRNLIGIDPEQNLVAVGDLLETRQQLMFCRRDGNSAQEDMKRMLERLRRRVADRTIRGGIYISCLGRGRYQFGENSEELKLIRQQLGNFPLVGYFANGEIYNGRLYGYTGVLSLFL